MAIISGTEMQILFDYFENTLFDELFLLHPTLSVNGRLSNEQLKILKDEKKEIVICLDRNILGRLLSAVKKGCFSGEYRKQTTAFLLWASINNFGLLPYDALKEQAFPNRDNRSANKEFALFETLFDRNVISDEILFKSFFRDGITFRPLSFAEADDTERIRFLDDTADYLFLYGSLLHFIYILRTVGNPYDQFQNFFEWYLKDNLISIYALTYFALYFAKNGISPPHWYQQNDRAIRGCQNEAFDLCYLQFMDPRRYPDDSHEFLYATCDKDIKKVFETANDRSAYSDIPSFFNNLFKHLPECKRIQYVEALNRAYSKHKKPNVNANNALALAKKFAKEQENLLSEFLRQEGRH